MTSNNPFKVQRLLPYLSKCYSRHPKAQSTRELFVFKDRLYSLNFLHTEVEIFAFQSADFWVQNVALEFMW